MTSFHISFPADFEDFAWELPSKGWFEVQVEASDRVYTIIFYDIHRLTQEVHDMHERGRAFVERNLVILKVVDRAHIEEAVSQLVAPHTLRLLRPDDLPSLLEP